jgi:triacylglycerol lipase
MSYRRRALVLALIVAAALLLVAGLIVGAASWLGTSNQRAVPAQDALGPVLLVPGYGGGTGGVDPLAQRIRDTGREAVVVALPDGGVGDLARQADVVEQRVNEALAAGAPSVDLIGYSAGGVVVRLWAQQHDGAHKARRIVTLGSPHHGADIAGVGVVAVPGACPLACQQLAPGSRFLGALATPVRTPPGWLAVWTSFDQTVKPPDSGRLEGAVNVELQAVCPAVTVDHSGLPTNPLVTTLVLRAIDVAPLRPPTPADCPPVSS